MIIRCERCSTTYDLDEALLAPTGSEVQCTKCEHVFVAHPPRAAGRTLVGVAARAEPAPAEPAPTPPRVTPPAPVSAPAIPAAAAAPPRSGPPPATAPAGAAPGAPAASTRPDGVPRPPVRTAGPQVYRPQHSGTPAGSATVHRGPTLKRDTVGAFEARLRWSARWRWLAPVLLASVLAAGVGLWLVLSRHGDSGADRTREEALELLAQDDSASVDDASARLAALVMKRPKLRAAAADRALALAIRAAAVGEEVDALNARGAAVREQRERARRDQPPGWEAVDRATSAESTAIEGDVRAREDRFRALSSGAREQLVVLQAEAGDTREVLRALAVLDALTGERDKLHRIVRAIREGGVRDPWVDLADGWSEARDPDRAARERALVKLGALAAARPDLVRGRWLLARAQLSLGKRAEAIATLDGVLATNPRHERAKRLRDELVAPAPVPPAALPPVAPVVPVGKPVARVRKPAAHPALDASAPAPPGREPGEAEPSRAPAAESAPAIPAGPAQAPAPAPAAPPPGSAPGRARAPSTATSPETAPPPPPPPRRGVSQPPPEEPGGAGD